jgi:putative nucleotidyltransferase with HDIG domain
VEGLFIQKSSDPQAEILHNDSSLKLLAHHEEMEIMIQTVRPDSIVFISPGDDPKLMEFYYILQGEASLAMPEGNVTLKEGESFYALGLKEPLRIYAENGMKLLYIASKPLFDYLYGYLGDLNELLIQTGKKDKFTYDHGKRVVQYCLKICDKIGFPNERIENILLASLFHDVGKFFVPDEILNKPSKLNDEEYRLIKKHTTDSAQLLKLKFGQVVADIAKQHHERLDGSGYPDGLKADEITMEGRIIAVADSLDAMTAERQYVPARPFEDAIKELKAEKGIKYDPVVVDAVAELYEQGQLP